MFCRKTPTLRKEISVPPPTVPQSGSLSAVWTKGSDPDCCMICTNFIMVMFKIVSIVKCRGTILQVVSALVQHLPNTKVLSVDEHGCACKSCHPHGHPKLMLNIFVDVHIPRRTSPMSVTVPGHPYKSCCSIDTAIHRPLIARKLNSRTDINHRSTDRSSHQASLMHHFVSPRRRRVANRFYPGGSYKLGILHNARSRRWHLFGSLPCREPLHGEDRIRFSVNRKKSSIPSDG